MIKSIFALLCAALLFGCHSSNDKDVSNIEHPSVDTLKPLQIAIEDNLVPDGRKLLMGRGKKKPVPQPIPTPTPTPTGTPGQAVLYYDFDGESVTSASWNGGQTFTCAPCNMSDADQLQCLYRAQIAYAAYNVIVTNDRTIYDASTNRQMMIVTASSAWFPTFGYSGVTYVGCLGTQTPGFIFSDRLFYTSQYVGGIMIHEAGHAFGLWHQSDFTSACGVINTYKMGDNMGNNLYVDQGLWDAQTCSQDDKLVLQTKLGLR